MTHHDVRPPLPDGRAFAAGVAVSDDWHADALDPPPDQGQGSGEKADSHEHESRDGDHRPGGEAGECLGGNDEEPGQGDEDDRPREND